MLTIVQENLVALKKEVKRLVISDIKVQETLTFSKPSLVSDSRSRLSSRPKLGIYPHSIIRNSGWPIAGLPYHNVSRKPFMEQKRISKRDLPRMRAIL